VLLNPSRNEECAELGLELNKVAKDLRENDNVDGHIAAFDCKASEVHGELCTRLNVNGSII